MGDDVGPAAAVGVETVTAVACLARDGELAVADVAAEQHAVGIVGDVVDAVLDVVVAADVEDEQPSLYQWLPWFPVSLHPSSLIHCHYLADPART